MTGATDVVMVRHAESEVNVDVPVQCYSEARLTAKGRDQAQRLASAWILQPSVAARSPFRAAAETAAFLPPRRSASLLVDQQLAEFRYLSAAFADGSNRAQRRERTHSYWERGDPHYRDGPDAESFADLLLRVRDVMGNPSYAGAAVVTHGMFILAAQTMVEQPSASPATLFHRFSNQLRAHGVVVNCAVVRVLRPHELART